MNNLSLEELQQFSYRLAIPAAVTLIINIFGFTTFGQIISVIIHIIVLGIFFLLFKEFKSAFLKLVLTGLLMCLVGEVLVFFNLENEKYTSVYWTFIGIHLARNLALGAGFGWNILKSHIFNPFWTKLIPYIVVVPIFFILEIFVFSLEESSRVFFIVYNATLCFMILTAALRWNHSSDRSYFITIAAVLAFVLAEIFYFWEFKYEAINPATLEKESSIFYALRAPFLQLGSCLIVSGTVDHVIHYKLTVKSRMYLPLTTPGQDMLKKKKGPVGGMEMKNILNIGNIGKKKLAEPLI